MADTAHPYLADVGCAEAILDKIADRDPTFLSISEKRQALRMTAHLASRAQAMHARVIACADDVADADGCRDVAAWVAHRTHTSGAGARRLQRLGVACELRWHRVGTALAGGHVSVDQGHVMVAALDDLTDAFSLVEASPEEWADMLARAETYLVEQAADFGPRELGRLAERLLEVVAPEWAEKVEEEQLRAAERRARRRTTLGVRHLGDGSAVIRAQVPESVALRLTTMLESFTNPRRARTIRRACCGRAMSALRAATRRGVLLAARGYRPHPAAAARRRRHHARDHRWTSRHSSMDWGRPRSRTAPASPPARPGAWPAPQVSSRPSSAPARCRSTSAMPVDSSAPASEKHSQFVTRNAAPTVAPFRRRGARRIMWIRGQRTERPISRMASCCARITII